MKKLIIVTFLAMLSASMSAVHATKPQMWLPLHVASAITTFDSHTNQVDLEIRFSIPTENRSYNCSTYETNILKIEDLTVLSDINWTLDFSSDTEQVRHVVLQLNPAKIGQLMVDFDCPEKGHGARLYRCFSVSDSLEMWTDYPYHLVKEAPTKVDWDTLSAEELAREYEIRILLRKASDIEKARGYFGRVPEIDSQGFATMTMSLKECLKMDRETNLESYLLNPAEWMPTVDSPNHPKNKKITD